MRVWIDADACPKAAKDQVIKFALKRQFEVVLVAGQSQIKPTYALVKLIVVPSGPDAADDYLVEHAVPGELVICIRQCARSDFDSLGENLISLLRGLVRVPGLPFC